MLRGLYSKHVFPCLCDWAMSSKELHPLRKQSLRNVSGRVLEIGFGTGLNLPFYPEGVEEVHAVDVNPEMAPKALKRIGEVSFAVQHHVISGESLPMENDSFDFVVSTFTLCSIAKVGQAIGEIWRVLRPGGQFCFLEHGLSPDPNVASWQTRLNPIQQVLGDGCHLNRPMDQIICSQPFQVRPIQTFYLEGVPRVIGCLYQEQARKPA
jgi:ubiquinone/menaquinone biosynthesis C-methylase UbiE